jgi:leucyl aminopeptidase (aminopeptidase T)
MDLALIEIMKNARSPIVQNVKPGDNVLIVADTKTEPLVWQALAAACVEVGADPIVTIMTPREFHQSEPPRPVAEAMMKSDLNILIPSKAILHSKPSHKAMKSGVPSIASEELTVDMLRHGASTANCIEMNEQGLRLLSIFNNGSTIRVTSQHGTDVTAKIGQGRKGWCVSGLLVKQEGDGLYNCAFPDGEVGVSPLEGTTQGKVVWDTSMHFVGLLKEPITAIIKEGVCVEITGGSQAQALKEAIERFGDENSYNFAEIAVGINPKARITGIMREDKKLYGSVHIALGDSAGTGGAVTSKSHVDGCIRYPSVWVDDKLIVENGKIFV